MVCAYFHLCTNLVWKTVGCSKPAAFLFSLLPRGLYSGSSALISLCMSSFTTSTNLLCGFPSFHPPGLCAKKDEYLCSVPSQDLILQSHKQDSSVYWSNETKGVEDAFPSETLRRYLTLFTPWIKRVKSGCDQVKIGYDPKLLTLTFHQWPEAATDCKLTVSRGC